MINKRHGLPAVYTMSAKVRSADLKISQYLGLVRK